MVPTSLRLQAIKNNNPINPIDEAPFCGAADALGGVSQAE